jgi:hypothetical protein
LPDGIFSNQKSQFGPILEGLASCNGSYRCILWQFGILYGYLVYFVAIWYILWLFGILFPLFGMLSQEKSGNPDCDGWQFFTIRLHTYINGMVDNKYVLAERDWSN